jgi:short-subunit dehydrogenase
MGGFALAGRTALLTGAGSGIGRASALELARRGMHLLLADVESEALEAVADEVRALGSKATPLEVDLAERGQLDALAERALAEAGGVHLLWNNAGVMVASQVKDMAWGDYEWIAAVNLWAPLRLTHRLLPQMLARGSGHLAVTASLTGLVTPPGNAAYGLTKAGLISFHEGLRAELRAKGIGVSVICPGLVRTGLFRRARIRDARYGQTVSDLPGWVGLRPERVARVAVRAIERGRPLVPLGWERGSLWLKQLFPGLYERYNALLARRLLER